MLGLQIPIAVAVAPEAGVLWVLCPKPQAEQVSSVVVAAACSVVVVAAAGSVVVVAAACSVVVVAAACSVVVVICK